MELLAQGDVSHCLNEFWLLFVEVFYRAGCIVVGIVIVEFVGENFAEICWRCRQCSFVEVLIAIAVLVNDADACNMIAVWALFPVWRTESINYFDRLKRGEFNRKD